MKKILAGALSVFFLLSPFAAAAAADELEGNWARAYIEYLAQIPYNGETGGVIRPNSATGKYDPDKQVTRAEFMRYVNRAFNFTEKAPVSQYTDLSANGWYMETVQIAAKHGYISGLNATTMAPIAPITREQVISVLGRLFKKNLQAVAPETLNFTDNMQIGKWSAAYVKDAVDAGIVRGYVDGSFKPTATVTRAEVASILYHYMGSSLNTAGTIYTSADIKPDTRNVTISAPCTLQDAVISGDLYITEGVTGVVNLKNITVQGDLIQSGGTLSCDGVTAARMVVDSPMGRLVEASATGSTTISSTEVRTAVSLSEKNLTGMGFSGITLGGTGAPSLTLDGNADVTASTKATVTTTASSVIDRLNANAAVTVSGYGAIRSATINAADCTLAMAPLNSYSIKEGLTALINGNTVSGSYGTPIDSVPLAPSPSTTSANPVSGSAPDQGTAQGTMQGTAQGTQGTTQGTAQGTTQGTAQGTTQGTPTFPVSAGAESAGETGEEQLPANHINLSAATFDRNPDSAAYQDLVVGLVAVDDAVFRRVVLGGLEVDASFSRSTITIDAEDLAEIYPGTYTLTYVMSAGDNPTLKLTIVDTGSAAGQYDFDAEWTGERREDVEIQTPKGMEYNKRTSVGSIKYNGNNLSSQKFRWELTGSDRLLITIDGAEIDKWFSDYDYPSFLDFDVKLTDPSETFTVRVWYMP